ncbi:DUF7446 family protein [Cronobacter sakazakii]|uniref:DUF7446 family protein n=2 Tax=Cronobacter sakazakii TaxID=28141 RepID=UPI000A1625E7|nr:hypothetical protein [Cronobacter sakazakii]PUV79692.1 hypothetical protein B7T08_07645 [Cronobacter sakazakii]PUV86488.1 hypothetical protein B7T10_10030 [Cronobacter sakazakii]PUV89084.1 hypothetical protein B7T11_11420 [Cronobacter sakazakii]
MGIKMQNNKNLEYRVDYTPLGGRLFAGFVRRDNGKWEGNRHEVTEQALLAVGKKLLSEGIRWNICVPDATDMLWVLKEIDRVTCDTGCDL